jgi:hypothetical protein
LASPLNQILQNSQKVSFLYLISSSYQQMCYKESKNGKAGELTSSWVTEP